MHLSIVGTGYVGLVTGACLAELGHRVTCVDIDPARVAALNAGRPPIHEPGLEELLQRHAGGRLAATTDTAAAVADSELTFIAVGTPFNGREMDLAAVLAAAGQVGAALRDKPDYHVVVVKSTVVPGTTETRVRPVLEAASGKRAGLDFGLGVNPEFLSEGQAVRDCLAPDRLVLGGVDARTLDVLTALYQPFPADIPRLRTNPRTAEMIKYASNTLLATLISFTNELANLGAALGGMDTVEVMRGVHLSQYFRGRNEEGLPPLTAFLRAGCGFGGSCLPKDLSALIAHGRQAGEPMLLLDAVRRVNEQQPARVLQLLRQHLPQVRGARVTVLGLAFKPDTGDVRESPAFPILRGLLAEGAVVTAHDPVAVAEARRVLGDERVTFCQELAPALQDAAAVIVVTPWPEYRAVPALLHGREPAPLFVDARRAFARDSVSRYAGIGL
jgi:UDPglucose 6-dehydrogenase/GDP-mannose 6-dehydrogenase